MLNLSLGLKFTAAFRKTHIPSGVVSLKKKEFRSLTQGSRSVTEYLHEFNRLARYAPEDVRNDEERQEKFLGGLNDELSYPLMVGDYPDFQKLVDKAIRQEDKYNFMEQKKRRIAHFKAQQGPLFQAASYFRTSVHVSWRFLVCCSSAASVLQQQCWQQYPQSSSTSCCSSDTATTC
jgi:Retrotransposon gag protein.